MTFFPLIRYILLIITSSGIIVAVGIRKVFAIRSLIAGNKIIYFQTKNFQKLFVVSVRDARVCYSKMEEQNLGAVAGAP
jgi:hypothetical protein